MERLARIATRLGPRCAFGVAAYWAANVGILFAEARWHVLSRLTLFDIGAIKAVAPELLKLLHLGIGLGPSLPR
jgi:hypothetical protein